MILVALTGFLAPEIASLGHAPRGREAFVAGPFAGALLRRGVRGAGAPDRRHDRATLRTCRCSSTSQPRNARDLALAAGREPWRAAAPTAPPARAELARLGGAALPHVLGTLDALDPVARGRVSLALVPVARRMGLAEADGLATPEQALVFWTRFWQDRSADFRAPVVRRKVARLAERALALRQKEVVELDTFAIPELIDALGRVDGRGRRGAMSSVSCPRSTTRPASTRTSRRTSRSPRRRAGGVALAALGSRKRHGFHDSGRSRLASPRSPPRRATSAGSRRCSARGATRDELVASRALATIGVAGRTLALAALCVVAGLAPRWRRGEARSPGESDETLAYPSRAAVLREHARRVSRHSRGGARHEHGPRRPRARGCGLRRTRRPVGALAGARARCRLASRNSHGIALRSDRRRTARCRGVRWLMGSVRSSENRPCRGRSRRADDRRAFDWSGGPRRRRPERRRGGLSTAHREQRSSLGRVACSSSFALCAAGLLHAARARGPWLGESVRPSPRRSVRCLRHRHRDRGRGARRRDARLPCRNGFALCRRGARPSVRSELGAAPARSSLAPCSHSVERSARSCSAPCTVSKPRSLPRSPLRGVARRSTSSPSAWVARRSCPHLSRLLPAAARPPLSSLFLTGTWLVGLEVAAFALGVRPPAALAPLAESSGPAGSFEPSR